MEVKRSLVWPALEFWSSLVWHGLEFCSGMVWHGLEFCSGMVWHGLQFCSGLVWLGLEIGRGQVRFTGTRFRLRFVFSVRYRRIPGFRVTLELSILIYF